MKKEIVKETALFLIVAAAIVFAAIFFASTWRASQGKCYPVEYDGHLWQVCEDLTSYTRTHDSDCGKCKR